MERFSRAQRRFDIERLKNNRKSYWGTEKTPRQLSIVVQTPKLCSCYMCGNPRKHFNELTMQERRHLSIASENW